MQQITEWWNRSTQRGEVYELVFLASAPLTNADVDEFKRVVDQRADVNVLSADINVGPTVVRCRVLMMAANNLARALGGAPGSAKLYVIAGSRNQELQLANVYYVETRGGLTTAASEWFDNLGASVDNTIVGAHQAESGALDTITKPLGDLKDAITNKYVIYSLLAALGLLALVVLIPRSK